jgi:hypothetical protein
MRWGALNEKIQQPLPALQDWTASDVPRLEFYRGKDDRH